MPPVPARELEERQEDRLVVRALPELPGLGIGRHVVPEVGEQLRPEGPEVSGVPGRVAVGAGVHYLGWVRPIQASHPAVHVDA